MRNGRFVLFFFIVFKIYLFFCFKSIDDETQFDAKEFENYSRTHVGFIKLKF